MEEFLKQFDFPMSDYVRGVIPKLIERNRVVQATLADLRTNPKFQEFFGQYHPDSIGPFIQFIARHQGRLFESGNPLDSLQEGRIMDPHERARWGLNEILQRHLFTKQCLWRAEKLKIPGVDICHDFTYWGNNIAKCPFLDPITEEDIALYTQYILGEDFQLEHESAHAYQLYENFKYEYQNDDEGTSMPEWYQFYDIRKGTSSLLILPDIRGKKEKKYFDAAYKQEKKEKKQAEIAAGLPPPVKRMDYYTILNLVVDCVLENEDDDMIRGFKQTNYNYKSNYDENGEIEESEDYDDETDGEAMEALSKLEYIPFKVPVEAHYDWKQGLVKALYNYETRQVADALKVVYEDYLMRRELGMEPDNLDEFESNEVQWKKNNDTHRERILKGRELKGEPRDFNF